MTQALAAEECPDENALLAFAAGALSDAERERLEAHVSDCADCCLVLGETAGSISPEGPSGVDGLTLSREVPGRYELLREIGSGGQGRVFAAFDHQLQREVALKLPVSEERERFLREAQLAARLDHPGIVSVYEIGTRADGSLYATQRLVRPEPGATRPRTLRDAFAQAATPSARVALLPRLISVAEAVAYAHGQSVVHHDLKPENVALGEHGETVVLDWGLAEELESKAAGATRSVRGTPGYMSPEQARGLRGDSTSDVFALGAMLYELLSGKRPAASPAPALRTVEPTVPPALASIAERALAVDPAARYPDASGFAADLSRWLSGGMVDAYDYALRERIGLSLRRHRQVIGFGAVVAGVLLIAASLAVAQNFRTRAALAQTLQEKGAAAQRRAAWDTAAALFAAALRLEDSDFARYGLSATLGHSRIKARVSPAGVTAIAALASSADGTQLAVGAQDGRILLYARGLAAPRELKGHTDVIKTLAFTRDGLRLVSGADDGKLLLWDLSTGASRLVFQSATPVNAAVIAPDGSWIAAGTEAGELGRWSASSLEQLARWQAHDHPLYGLAVSPTGDVLASGSWDRSVKRWSTDGVLLSTLTGHTDSVLAVAYSPSGALASGSRDTTIRLWPADGTVGQVLTGHTQKVNALVWLSDKRLASTGDDAVVRYWNLEDFQPEQADNEAIEEDGIALARNGDRLWVAGGGGVICSLRVPEATFASPLFFTHLDLDSGGHLVGLGNKDFVTIDPASLKILDRTLLEDLIRDLRPLPQGGFVLTRFPSPGALKLVPADGPPKLLLAGGALLGLGVSADGDAVGVGGADSTVAIFNRPFTAPPQVLAGHTAPVFDIAFTPTRIFTASYDKTIGIFDRKTGQRLGALLGHWSGVRSVAISPDGRHAASGGWDKTVRLWELDPPRLVKTLLGHEGYVTSVAFDPSGSRLVSAGWDGRVIIWDVARGEPLVTLTTNELKLKSVRFLGPDRVLAAGGQIFTFTYNTEDPRAVLRSLAAQRGAVLENTNVALVPFGAGLLEP